jgi:hypothetical protein
MSAKVEERHRETETLLTWERPEAQSGSTHVYKGDIAQALADAEERATAPLLELLQRAATLLTKLPPRQAEAERLVEEIAEVVGDE